jgi:hypothetical protein
LPIEARPHGGGDGIQVVRASGLWHAQYDLVVDLNMRQRSTPLRTGGKVDESLDVSDRIHVLHPGDQRGVWRQPMHRAGRARTSADPR